MCRAVSCAVCGKTTWAGCGQHIASVKRSVPAANWCEKQHTAEELAAARGQGFFAGLLNWLTRRGK